MSVTANQLQEFFDAELGFTSFNSPVFFDSGYSLATRAWLTQELAAAVRQTIQTAGLVYETNQNDCEDFALFEHWLCLTALILAKQTHRATGLKTGLAIGLLGYQTDAGPAHCICFGVVREAERLALVFIEPQNGQEITLSANEKTNCLFLFM